MLLPALPGLVVPSYSFFVSLLPQPSSPFSGPSLEPTNFFRSRSTTLAFSFPHIRRSNARHGELGFSSWTAPPSGNHFFFPPLSSPPDQPPFHTLSSSLSSLCFFSHPSIVVLNSCSAVPTDCLAYPCLDSFALSFFLGRG